MGLTSALNTSLNGLSLNETMIDVLGNNIANSGTNGRRSSIRRDADSVHDPSRAREGDTRGSTSIRFPFQC